MGKFRDRDSALTISGRVSVPEKSAPPRRQNNKHTREHEWITYDEFKAIRAAAASTGRNGHRDALMISMAFRHGLRTVELVNMEWSSINLERRTYVVHRAKKGQDTTHDLTKDEVKALKELEPDPAKRTGYVFKTERTTGARQFTTNGFFKIVQRAGRVSKFSKPLHPHMFRHGCGFYMVNRGVDIKLIKDWLGHRNIQNTDLYTQLSPERLKGAFPAFPDAT